MKKRYKSIKVNGSGSYKIVDGVITSTLPFEVKEKGDEIILNSLGGGNISINGSNISISGRNGSVSIGGITIGGSFDGDIVMGNNNIVINGKKVDFDDENDICLNDDESDNGIKEYDFDAFLSGVSIQGSGSFEVDGNISDTEIKKIALNVSGSGDIILTNYNDIDIMASVAGSGDITARKSTFKSVMKSVAGSGDINGI